MSMKCAVKTLNNSQKRKYNASSDTMSLEFKSHQIIDQVIALYLIKKGDHFLLVT